MFTKTFSKFLISILLSSCIFVVVHQLLTLSPIIITLVHIIFPPLEHLVIDYLFEIAIVRKE